MIVTRPVVAALGGARRRRARPRGVRRVAADARAQQPLATDLSFTGVEREHAETGVLLASVVAGLVAALVLGGRNRKHAQADHQAADQAGR